MRSRRRSAKPRSSRQASKAGARTPPPNLVTSRDTAEILRLQAKVFRLEGELRKRGTPGGNRGPRPRTNSELENLAGLFAYWTSGPALDPLRRGDKPPRPRDIRYFGKEPLFLEHSAEMIDAQVDGRALPDTPPELVFVADCDQPMSANDALRNVARYLGVGVRQAWEQLRKGMRVRHSLGLDTLGPPPKFGLPPRPARGRAAEIAPAR